ncbi:MAG: hypothetical protein HY540_08205 [Deltaproteobacteria bacterium]|nr:hypothetical protein [Deltaproteobacteria bacterium]
MTFLSPIAMRNWTMGFYRPLAAIAAPKPSPQDIAEFQRIGSIPISFPRNAIDFLAATARVLPSTASLQQAMHEGRISISISAPNESCLSGIGAKGKLILSIPRNTRPMQVFPDLIQNCASLLDPPDGVTLPADEVMPSLELAEERYWQIASWRMALAATFLFQTSLELHYAGLQELCDRFLQQTDLALFRIFRRGGLPLLAEHYPLSIPPDRHHDVKTLHHHRALSSFRRSSIATRWTAPQVEPREFPQTFLDERADAPVPFLKGLYTQANVSPFTESEKERINRQLDRAINTEEDLLALRQTIEILAPELSRTLFPSHEIGRATFSLSGQPLPQPAIEEIFFGNFFRWFRGERCSLHILVQRGLRLRHILEYTVIQLAARSMPTVFFSRIPVPTRKKESLADFAYRVSDISHLWGYTALFEFAHEAHKRGVDVFQLSPHQQRMRKVVEVLGFPTLLEQWQNTGNPAAIKMMKTQFVEKAGEYLRMGGTVD